MLHPEQAHVFYLPYMLFVPILETYRDCEIHEWGTSYLAYNEEAVKAASM